MSKERLIQITVWLGSIVLAGLLLVVSWNVIDTYGTIPAMGQSAEITHVTSGVIEADTLIAVRFRLPQIGTDSVGEKLTRNPFAFTPHIAGEAYWEDIQTLVFKPAKPLYDKGDYSVLVSLAGEERIRFTFSTMGQTLAESKGQFLPIRQGGEGQVYFLGTITFTERVEKGLLNENLRLKLGDRLLPYSVETSDNLTFRIESEQLERYQAHSRILELVASGPPLGLDGNLQLEYILSSLASTLEVIHITEEKTGEFSQLRITFSDNLIAERDYRGYLHITPVVDFTAQVDGNELLISGEFRPQEKYSIEFFPGLKSEGGKQLSDADEYFWEVQISDLKPAVEFIDEGMLLTTAAQKRIAFRTMNVNRLRLQVKKVKEDNLLAFYEENSYQPGNRSFAEYNRYRFMRLGEVIEDRTIEIGTERNRWIRSELDLSNVLKADEGALYIIQLDFDQTQALYFPTTMDSWDIAERVAQQGKAVKHVLVSDIGITAKEMLGDLHVFLSNLVTTEPIGGALVVLRDKYGKTLDSAYSNETGAAGLEADTEGRYLEVRSGEMSALMDLQSSRLNVGLFDIGGVQKKDGVDAFIYTERGVYRPGDQINLSALVRNEDHTFPDDHPVSWRIYNPQDRLIYEETLIKAKDGFYNCSFTTESNAPTGNWWALLNVGGRVFVHNLKIEEIVPYRIRVAATPTLSLEKEDQLVEFLLRSEYLFGAPAAGLESESTISLESYERTFPAYSKFTFSNATVGFIKQERNFVRKLNSQGEARLIWELPQVSAAPSALRLRLESKVYESGGRSVPYTKTVPIDFYPRFVGIMKLENPALGRGERADFRVVHLSQDGEPIAGSELEYTMYRLRYYWWWEYNNEMDFRRYFKQNERLIVAEQGVLQTDADGFAQFEYQPDDYGEIILEVKDPKGGHSAAYFFRSYWWGEEAGRSTPTAVTLKMDKKSYAPGETAKVTVSAPVGSRALFTVEKEGKLLEQRWHEIEQGETEFTVQVTEEHMPNAYLSLMILQPYGQKANDLPLRLYGIAPLLVTSDESEIGLELELPAVIRPEERFTLKIQTENHQQAQFTVAVVDEGLLNITGFVTPNPHGHFFSKQRLLTKNYDNFSDVIDLSFGYLDNVFTVGGGEEADYRKMQTPKQDALRFEAVSLFTGPLETDEQGYAEVELQLPNYIGSVRVMVVAAAGGSYGKAEQDVPVKAPLMVLPTLPRILRPQDQIIVPVTVFALEEDLGEVEVTIAAAGPVRILGPAKQLITFSGEDSTEVFFRLGAQEEIGTAEIVVSAEAQGIGYSSRDRTSLPIRAPNPYIYLSQEKIANEEETVTFSVPPPGVPGTERIQLSVSPWRGMNIEHRLKWLIRYPYLCLEQITSAVFPQLYLPELAPLSQKELAEIDDNINAAIQALREYQLSSGGFAYWPGGGVANLWSTNYAGHFLLEAKNKGYHVPSELLEGWKRFQRKTARANTGTRHTRAYRLYLLALADNPELSALNYMRESELDQLSNGEKHLLAAAYHVLGFSVMSRNILATAELDVTDQQEGQATFGSPLRDRAMLLDTLLIVGDYQQGALLYEQIAKDLASNRWYSTQTTAYGLLAVSKYIAAMSAQTPIFTGELVINGETVAIKEAGTSAVIPLSPTQGQTVTFKNTTSIPLFVMLTWEGIPKPEDLQPEQKKLKLKVDYYDADGRNLDVTQLKQGTEFYGVFRVSQDRHEHLSELALVQVLPAGWEIENLRLLGGRLPEWTEEYNLWEADYLDLRDDRIMWFFDMYGWAEDYVFIVKLNAVTVGTFSLPPTLLEAMYDNDYKVVTEGGIVEVHAR